jgi:hypothetical protein
VEQLTNKSMTGDPWRNEQPIPVVFRAARRLKFGKITAQLLPAQIHAIIVCVKNILQQYSEAVDWCLPHPIASRTADATFGQEVSD